ncbi:4'-phosphopantetheinyl transferase superfamily protein [Candidatus Roizmanbacteria bacterium]|nr:4'-phosphopantetheinyl transferase superfamily protein [Candidatus Roizmanbacteria bacterium]
MKQNLKIGIDLVYIPDFEAKIKKRGKLFIKRIFSSREISETKKIASLAGKYACKEAFIKTLGKKMYRLNEIEILKLQDRPYVLFKGKKFFGVSISHAGSYAAAAIAI